jgi:hypothetical protein
MQLTTTMSFAGADLRKKADDGFVEELLMQAYISLYLSPRRDDGSKCAQLTRYGAYEVRLLELYRNGNGKPPSLWLELYSHDTLSVLDSCACSDFDEALAAAETLILQARQAHHETGPQ